MRFVIMAGCLFFRLAVAHGAQISGAMSFQGDTVHLEFSGQQNWDYGLKRLDRKGQFFVEMTVPPMDDSTIQSLSAFKSEIVTNVSIDRNGPDGKHVLALELAGESIDTFDYLTDQPSRLIVDFFVNPTSRPKKTIKSIAAKETKKPAEGAKEVQSDSSRKPATADILGISNSGSSTAQSEGPVKMGIFDGGDPDYSRFAVKNYEIKEEALIRGRDNYYIPFPMLETPVSQWEKIKASPVIYQVSRQDNDENKQARLLLALFEKERFGVFLKTEQWFREKYPNSAYREVIDFMTADVYLTLAQKESSVKYFDEALLRYRDAIKKYPKSLLSERTSLKTGFLALEKSDNLSALRLFKEHIDNPHFGDQSSLSKDLSRLGSALAYAKMNRWTESIKQLDELERESKNRDIKVDSAYRRGDVWARAKDHTKAVEEYRRALKKFPEGENSYPNAVFNLAESLFWVKDFQGSLDVYRDFIKKFPESQHAPFAMTRIGELLDIFGVDKSRVMGAFLETYFRFGENPSAVVARLRLLSTRMKGMKPKEVDHAVNEIMSLAEKIDLPNIEQFATVMVADGYTRREEFQRAIDLLSKYYKEHPSSGDLSLLKERIIANINDKLRQEVGEGRFIDVLRTHSQYADSWLKNSNRLETKYSVGRAFEMAGAPVEAEKYYRDTLNRVYAIRGTAEAKEVEVKERVPSSDELNLRLASVFFQQQKYNQAYEHLKNIKSPEQLNEKAQIERVDVAVHLLEKRGDSESAVRYLGELLRTWKGRPELVAQPYLKLAELQLKKNQPSEALQALEMIGNLQKDSGKVPGAVEAKALEMKGDIYLSQKKTEKAIDAYRHLLEKFEDSRPLSSLRYKLGKVHFEEGSIQKAAEVWNKFKGDQSIFWQNLAQEQLKNSEWRDDYKKYIKRIPAMSEVEQGN